MRKMIFKVGDKPEIQHPILCIGYIIDEAWLHESNIDWYMRYTNTDDIKWVGKWRMGYGIFPITDIVNFLGVYYYVSKGDGNMGDNYIRVAQVDAFL